MPSAVDYGLQLYFIVTKIVTSLLWGAVVDGPLCSCGGPRVPRVQGRPRSRHPGLHATDSGAQHTPPSPAREPPLRAGQRSPYPSNERTSPPGSTLRLLPSTAARLPDYASGSRQESQIDLGATPNDLARKLGLSIISGPRGTATRLKEQLYRLLHMKLEWQTSLGLAPRSSESAYVIAGGASWLKPLRGLFPRQPPWQPQIVLSQDFFEEITRSAVPVDLRAIRQLQRSPLAIDLYVWLTYRMSYLRKPTVVPWKSLEAQFGADYTRPRDFRRRVSELLEAVLCTYPTARISLTDIGLRLYPSPPHVQRSRQSAHRATSAAPQLGRIPPTSALVGSTPG